LQSYAIFKSLGWCLDSTHARWLYFLAKRGPQGLGIGARRRAEARRAAKRKSIETNFQKHVRKEKRAKMAKMEVTKVGSWVRGKQMSMGVGVEGVVDKVEAVRKWMRVGRKRERERERVREWQAAQREEELREWQMVSREVPGAFPDEDLEEDGFVVVDRDGF
jgi:hypothetical protein